jgi:hypothetical protein
MPVVLFRRHERRRPGAAGHRRLCHDGDLGERGDAEVREEELVVVV